jgi:serine/threonine protein kinase
MFGEINDKGYSALCDMWSLGMIYYELIFGQLPFPEYTKSYDDLINWFLDV